MRLALRSGDVDFRQMGDMIPDEIHRAWAEFERLEPFGTEHLYEFLAHAFCKLAKAFHLQQYALDLESSDFLWWGDHAKERESKAVEETVTVAQMERIARQTLRAQQLRERIQAARKKK